MEGNLVRKYIPHRRAIATGTLDQRAKRPKVSIAFDQDLFDELRGRAKRQKKPFAFIVRQLLREAVE